MWRLRLVIGVFISLLPSCLKVWALRGLYGYEVGQNVKLGFGTLFVDTCRCRIGSGTRTGVFNAFVGIDELIIGEQSRIGHFNLFRGGRVVEIGPFVTIMRLNVFNAIREPVAANEYESVLRIGCAAVVTTGHWLDFTDQIVIGDHTIVGGRGSSMWTHSRQRTRAITIGQHCYLGSEVRLAPGVTVPPQSIVALGAVLLERFDEPRTLIAGNPASVQRPLSERDLSLVMRKTRDDLPEALLSQNAVAESGDGPSAPCFEPSDIPVN